MKKYWRKHIAVWRNRLYLYPPPEPMPSTRAFWVATGLVALLVLIFAAYFILLLTGRQAAFSTSAEDLGIMDQAIWNILHGQALHQTICNSISDTNCYGLNGTSRFAIHFEPILFPVALLYLVAPGPNTLLILQTLVVASGAFPAFWFARLRLRSNLAGVVIAALYLLYPAQQQATTFDFHAVTFTAALLLFTLYCMYTRRTIWLLIFAILSMACKEEIPLVIVFFGLWSILFQQRWRSGITLALLGVIWFAAAYLIMRANSPAGHPLLISRYAGIGRNPVQMVFFILRHPIAVLRTYGIEYYHRMYLYILLAPAAFLPLFAPWILILALPSLAINMLSSDPNQFSGFFQYNAEIIPVLIFSTIEGIVVILRLLQYPVKRWLERGSSNKRGPGEGRDTPCGCPATLTWQWLELIWHWLKLTGPPLVGGTLERPRLTSSQSILTLPSNVRQAFQSSFVRRSMHLAALVVLLGLVLLQVLRTEIVYGALPFSNVGVDSFQGATPLITSFQWPQTTAHTALAQHFVRMIPPNASVSAQSHLVPHLSERSRIYLFPYGDTAADYIFLDVTGNTYPLPAANYIHAVKQVLFSGTYSILAAQDGYLLLKRGLSLSSSAGIHYASSASFNDSDINELQPHFPAGFCSFMQEPSQNVPHSMQVTFTQSGSSNSLQLVGESTFIPAVYSLGSSQLQIITYWKVNAPVTTSLQMLALVTDSHGVNHLISTVFPALAWCPTTTWKPGTVMAVVSDIFTMQHIPNGLAHISLALLPTAQPFSTMMNVQAWLPVHIEHAPGTITYANRSHSLELANITIVP